MAEREVVFSGVGGQGVQLAGKVLGLAATRAGLFAMLAADYGGEMRGGPSKASVVVGDAPLRALPVLPSCGSAILAHHRFSEPVLERVRPGGLVVVNAKLIDPSTLRSDLTVHGVEPGTHAIGFVLLGAYNALVGIVEPGALVAAMTELLPPYRRQHVEANTLALEEGARLGARVA